MRIFSLVPVLAALATAVAGVPLPRDVGNIQMFAKRDFSDQRVSRNVGGLTNAELLRRGLPPKGPVMRRGTPVRRTNPSSAPPPPKTTHTGVIKALNTDGTLFGYVSRSFSIGQVVSSDRSNVLTVSFVTTDRTGSGSQLDLIAADLDTVNGVHYPRLGLTQGRADIDDTLAPGSFQYTYLSGTGQTPPGSLPVSNVPNSYTDTTGTPRDVESAVWNYDSKTGALTPHWINPDKSVPAVQIWIQDNNNFYVGADSDAFFNSFTFPVTILTLVFVPQ